MHRPQAATSRRTILGIVLAGGLAGSLAAQPAPRAGPTLTPAEAAARLEKAGEDPLRLLELVPLLGDKEAARARQEVKALLLKRKPIADPEELDKLARDVARALPAAARSPAEVRELLGPPREVLRQVLYRRSVEQWHYDTPLTLCVVLTASKGQAPRVQTVRLPRAAKP
jgi:hypothetical protein